MKTLQVINSFVGGGAERLMLDLHQGLLAHGIDSHAVSLEASDGQLPNCYSLGLSSCYQLPAIWKLFWLLRQPQWRDLDLIHVHLFPSQLYLPILLKILGIKAKLVTTEHSTLNRRIDAWVGKILDPLMYGAYRQIICNSQGTLAMMARWQPQLQERMRLIYNGTDLEKYQTADRQHSRTKPIVISVGRLAKPKNYVPAIEAISQLVDLDFEYWIVGGGVLESELKALVTSLNLDAKIKFLGYRSDVPTLLAQADIFLQTSIWEGFGLAVVEAMAAGLPAIASAVPGLQEVVGDNPNCGFLVDPHNPVQIAQQLRILLENVELRSTMSDNATIRATIFDIKKTIKEHLILYHSLCQP